MSTAVDEWTELKESFDQVLVCQSESCDNPGEWVRKHGTNCVKIDCTECKEFTQGQLAVDETVGFVCIICNSVETRDYWLKHARWVSI